MNDPFLDAIRRVIERDRRRAKRAADVRLAAAVMLAGRVEVCEALLFGVAVPVRRLHPSLAAELDLGRSGVVVLNDALALRVTALGPLPIPDDKNGATR